MCGSLEEGARYLALAAAGAASVPAGRREHFRVTLETRSRKQHEIQTVILAPAGSSTTILV
jgi:hypothetical protein